MGFSFNGIHSSSMGIRARLTSWQFIPAVNNNTVIIPGKSGVADFGASKSSRRIAVKCGVSPTGSMSALISHLDVLAQWLDPVNGLQMLVFDELPDRYFSARIDAAIDCTRLIRGAGSFDLDFFCPDPFGYAVIDENFTLTSFGEHTLLRTKGNAVSLPEYRLMGEVINNSSARWFKITTNGVELTVSGRLAANEVLVIDSANMTAKVVDTDGVLVKNGLPFLSSLNLPELNMGSNTVNIVAEGCTFKSLAIQSKSRWR
ncbi:MAG: phage tail family protein [Sphaerochaeta sp.]|nr:phage tail family protein [Sphaerochaeta sp.]MDD3512430.1 phage tail family protein [Synergistaceae bacterium]MDD3916249.1 phage tail family protein [Synergistaceae bacterium]